MGNCKLCGSNNWKKEGDIYVCSLCGHKVRIVNKNTSVSNGSSNNTQSQGTTGEDKGGLGFILGLILGIVGILIGFSFPEGSIERSSYFKGSIGGFIGGILISFIIGLVSNWEIFEYFYYLF